MSRIYTSVEFVQAIPPFNTTRVPVTCACSVLSTGCRSNSGKGHPAGFECQRTVRSESTAQPGDRTKRSGRAKVVTSAEGAP